MSPRLLLLLAFSSACTPDLAKVEPEEWLPGGETTNRLLLGNNAYARPSANLTAENEQDFYSGNSFFNQAWVEAPASTAHRDGLGPLFNARSCSACHFRDGKGVAPPAGEGPFEAMLIRLSVPGPDGPVPDPVYGGQLQDAALPDVAPEAVPVLEWIASSVTLDDGTVVPLRAPAVELTQPGYGPLPDDLQTSLRLPPHMTGLGLLEAIPDARLLELADPDDDDGDGISGRVQVLDEHDGALGRFGWKGDAPDVAIQSAGAFAGDLGLTSRLHLNDDCTEAQPECTEHPDGGSPEIEDHILDLVITYSRSLAPPARRAAEDEPIRRGKRVFGQLGCDTCHVPRHVTGTGAQPAFTDQTIYPYTDLLLHDMGTDLADGRPLGRANGQEWRTPPLWGLGFAQVVGGEDVAFLHDGRARTLEEAILWHGGEAQEAQEGYRALDADERTALIAFLEDL